MISISGRNTSTCALAVMSIQTLMPAPAPAKPTPPLLAGLRRAYARSNDQRFHSCRPERRRLLLDVALVPQREGEQAPELPAPVLHACDVLVEQTRHRLRLEEPLRAQRRGRERRAGERLELPAQPGCGWDREAALAAVYDLARHERRGGFAQEDLLREAAHL